MLKRTTHEPSRSLDAVRTLPAWFFLLALALSWLDRVLPNVFLDPIRQELSLTDAQLGLLTGTAFALCYALGALPAGWLADRTHRPRLLAAGIAVWSLLTMAVAATQSFSGLFVCRMGIGLGEAVLLPTAYSLINDLYDERQKARAVAIMSLGVPIGSGAALIGGSHLEAAFAGSALSAAAGIAPWRLVFATVGASGLAIALLALALPERRGGAPVPTTAEAAPPASMSAFLHHLASRKGLVLPLVIGAALFNMPAAGLLGWMVALMTRSYGVTAVQAGGALGTATLVTGLLAAPLSLALIARLRARHRTASSALLLSACSAAAAAGAVGAASLGTFTGAVAFLAATLLAVFVATAVLPLAIMATVAPAFTARGAALVMFVASIFGTAAGPLAIGLLSDGLFGAGNLQPAIAAGCGTLFLCAAASFLLTGRRLRALGAASG